jgi:hypothetical protein
MKAVDNYKPQLLKELFTAIVIAFTDNEPIKQVVQARIHQMLQHVSQNPGWFAESKLGKTAPQHQHRIIFSLLALTSGTSQTRCVLSPWHLCVCWWIDDKGILTWWMLKSFLTLFPISPCLDLPEWNSRFGGIKTDDLPTACIMI